MKKLFYRPEGAVCADFIPFCEGGAFELFYLRDWRDEAAFGRGTPWYRISTDDFLHYREHRKPWPGEASRSRISLSLPAAS